jgi:hypothetical protein
MVHRADRRQRSEDRGDEVESVNAEVGRKKRRAYGVRLKVHGKGIGLNIADKKISL